MKKIICMLLLIQGGFLMAQQTETVVTPNGKKVQVNAVPVTANNGLTMTNGNIQLDGNLIKPTTLTTSATNTLTIGGLQTGAGTDNVLVADANGVLKWITRAQFGGGDNLGNHIATQDLNMSSKNIIDAGNVTAVNLTATTKTTTPAAQITTGAGAGKLAVSDATGNLVWTEPSIIAVSGDNLGNHTATQDLNMNSKNITAANNVTATGTVASSNITASIKAIVQTAAITKGVDGSTPALGSLATSLDDSGNVVWKSPASVIAANQVQADWNMTSTTDPAYIRNKPAISTGDNLGNHIATQDLNMSSKNIIDAGNVTAVNLTATTKITTPAAQITSGAGAGKVAVSDASGNLTWTDASTVQNEPWFTGSDVAATSATNTTGGQTYFKGWVGIGGFTTPSAAPNEKLRVNGAITTVNSYYADYVFEDYFKGFSDIKADYKFKSLADVDNFIKENKHLPGITPINELQKTKEGYMFNVSELSVQLLEKTEELYLHVIEQEKELKAKDVEIQLLNERLAKLESIVLEKK